MAKALPLVLHLQSDALDPECRTTDLLRRAKVVASKIGASEACLWIDRELNGYGDDEKSLLPSYRTLKGLPRSLSPHGSWDYISSDDPEMTWVLGYVSTSSSVGELASLVEGDKGNNGPPIRFGYSDDVKADILRWMGVTTEVALFVSPARVYALVDHLRTLVLNWTLDLDKAGVLGEGMTFSHVEKQRALTVTNNYIAHNIGVAGNVTDQARVHNQMVAAGGLDLAKVQDLVTQLQQMAPSLPPDLRDGIASDVATLADEVTRPAPDQGKIGKALASVRTIFEGASGNLIASGVINVAGRILGS